MANEDTEYYNKGYGHILLYCVINDLPPLRLQDVVLSVPLC